MDESFIHNGAYFVNFMSVLLKSGNIILLLNHQLFMGMRSVLF